MKKIIFATGGTGGHIYPAIAVATELEKKGVSTLFVGSKYRMEKDVIPQNGFKFIGLPIKKLKKFGGFLTFFYSILLSFRLIKKEKPTAVFGFGNYTMVPIMIAAFFLKTPIYLHEQNVEIGLANKMFLRFSKVTFISFDETYNDIPIKYIDKVKSFGNPIRKEFEKTTKVESRDILKIGKERKVVLILGGSLGARSINNALLSKYEELSKYENLDIFWITGNRMYKNIVQKIEKKSKNIKIFPYLKDIYLYMSACDLIFCRSGASTISEILTVSKPSILIPYNFVGQKRNAQILVNKKCAYCFDDEKVLCGIDKMLELMYRKDILEEMLKNVKKLKRINISEQIIENLKIWRT